MRERETRLAKALDFHLQDPVARACVCLCVFVYISVQKERVMKVKKKHFNGKINVCIPPPIILLWKTVILPFCNLLFTSLLNHH